MDTGLETVLFRQVHFYKTDKSMIISEAIGGEHGTKICHNTRTESEREGIVYEVPLALKIAPRSNEYWIVKFCIIIEYGRYLIFHDAIITCVRGLQCA